MRDTVSKWVPISDPMLQRRMGKTGEECAELCSVVSRVQIQGIDEVDPSSGKTNRQRLEEEIADVYAQLDECVSRLGLRDGAIQARRHRKRRYMQEWEAMFEPRNASTPDLCAKLAALADEWDKEGPLPAGWTVSLHAEQLRALLEPN